MNKNIFCKVIWEQIQIYEYYSSEIFPNDFVYPFKLVNSKNCYKYFILASKFAEGEQTDQYATNTQRGKKCYLYMAERIHG